MKQLPATAALDIVKLKWGGPVTELPSTAMVSNRVLARIFGISQSQVRRLYTKYFHEIKEKNRPLIERL